jgi:hypothetical protein
VTFQHDERLLSGKFDKDNVFHFLQPLHSTSHVNFKNRKEAELQTDIFQVENSRTINSAFQKLCRGEAFAVRKCVVEKGF